MDCVKYDILTASYLDLACPNARKSHSTGCAALRCSGLRSRFSDAYNEYWTTKGFDNMLHLDRIDSNIVFETT